MIHMTHRKFENSPLPSKIPVAFIISFNSRSFISSPISIIIVFKSEIFIKPSAKHYNEPEDLRSNRSL